MIFRELNAKEEKEFRLFVDEDEQLSNCIKKLNSYHPVIRDEFIKRISKVE